MSHALCLLSLCIYDKTCVINDPLDQTHSPTSSDHYFHTTFVVFCDILKSGDGSTDGILCKKKVTTGRVDQYMEGLLYTPNKF